MKRFQLSLVFAILSASSGCRAAGSEPLEKEWRVLDGPPPESSDSIGFFLLEFDESLRTWQDLKLRAEGPRAEATLRALENDLARRSQQRQAALVRELESGPPQNRSVAAAALGFTRDPKALSPLLGALADPDVEVQSNALLALGLLEQAETPLGEILRCFRTSRETSVRNNAAYALQRIVARGARHEELFDACVSGLADEDPFVRAQTASVLGLMGEMRAIGPLSGAIYDDDGLASAAAAHALTIVGQRVLEAKGPAARALAASLERIPSGQREVVERALVRLHDGIVLSDAEEWRAWAQKMP